MVTDAENVVGDREVGKALVADYISESYLVDRAEYLNDSDRHREYRGAVQIALTFLI